MEQGVEAFRLRIAVFAAVYSPILSGISVGVHQRIKYLLNQGHHIFLAHPKIDNQYPVKVRKCHQPGLDELQGFLRFSEYAYPTKPIIFSKFSPEPMHHRYWSDTKLLEQFQPDIILVEEPAQMRGCCSLLLGGYGRPIGSEYAKKTGTPILSIFHTDLLAYADHYLGHWFSNLLSPLIAKWIENFTESYDVNFFPSQMQLDKYKGMKGKCFEYLSCQGIDCQRFQPQNITYDPIPDDPRPVLLFVGRIAREKNILQLLTAFPLITAKFPDLHLVIVGSGPQEDEVRQCASNIPGITVWGESMGTELLGWFARADIFVNPSVTENFCTTNMEALASGTPVVAAAAGGNIEQIVPGQNGLLAQPNNPIDLASQVTKMLESDRLRSTMAQQARPSIQDFDWTTCMKRFEKKLYQYYLGTYPLKHFLGNVSN